MGDGLAQVVNSAIQVWQGAGRGWNVGSGVEEGSSGFRGAYATADQGLSDEGMAADGVVQCRGNVKRLGIQPPGHIVHSGSQVVGADRGV